MLVIACLDQHSIYFVVLEIHNCEKNVGQSEGKYCISAAKYLCLNDPSILGVKVVNCKLCKKSIAPNTLENFFSINTVFDIFPWTGVEGFDQSPAGDTGNNNPVSGDCHAGCQG